MGASLKFLKGLFGLPSSKPRLQPHDLSRPLQRHPLGRRTPYPSPRGLHTRRHPLLRLRTPSTLPPHPAAPAPKQVKTERTRGPPETNTALPTPPLHTTLQPHTPRQSPHTGSGIGNKAPRLQASTPSPIPLEEYDPLRAIRSKFTDGGRPLCNPS